MAETGVSGPWHAAYPSPRNKDPESISRADLLQRLQAGEKPGVAFLLVDLRRTDHEVDLKLTTICSTRQGSVVLLLQNANNDRAAPSVAH